MIGNIYLDDYDESISEWCIANNAFIEEIEPQDGHRRFQIVAVPEPTAEELFMQYRSIATNYLNATAQERLYDDIKSLKGFVTSTNEKWRSEATAAIKFEDDVWAKCYEILNAVKAGEMEIPTPEEFVAMLPKFDWGE